VEQLEVQTRTPQHRAEGDATDGRPLVTPHLGHVGVWPRGPAYGEPWASGRTRIRRGTRASLDARTLPGRSGGTHRSATGPPPCRCVRGHCVGVSGWSIPDAL